MKEPKEKIKRHDRTQNNKQMDDIYIIYRTVIFRSVGTCPSVPRSVFRDLYCKVVGINTVRSAERTDMFQRSGK